MRTVTVAQAKARLSEILHEVETGGEVVITRRHQPIARLCPMRGPREPIDFAAMDALRARQPMSKVSSVDLIRKMRDERY
jgi:prevent-host-death family protein